MESLASFVLSILSLIREEEEADGELKKQLGICSTWPGVVVEVKEEGGALVQP